MCELYNRIHEELVRKGLNDSQFCTSLGFPASMLSDLKTGKKKSLSLENTVAIAKELGLSLDYLVLGIKKEPVPKIKDELIEHIIDSILGLSPAEAQMANAYIEGLIANRAT